MSEQTPKKSPPLSKVQATYIQARMDRDTAEEIANELGLPTARVARFITRLRNGNYKASVPPGEAVDDYKAKYEKAEAERQLLAEELRKKTAKPRHDFDIHPSGAVCMTERQSIADDERAGIRQLPNLNREQVALIQEKMDIASAGHIASILSLPVATVETAIKALKGGSSGREAFYRRNQAHLFKPRPDEPHR